MRFRRCSALFFAVSALAFAQSPQLQQVEPLKIKGIYLGQTVQDYLVNSEGKAR